MKNGMVMNCGWRPTAFACAVAGVALLAGCQRIGEQVAALYSKEATVGTPTLVIPPGYEAVLAKTGLPGAASPSRETVMLSGFDKCPTQDPLMERFFGPAPNDDQHDCVVLDKAHSSVKIRVAHLSDRRVTVEQWAIKRDASPTGERITLIPPSGALVLEAPRHS
jgi:hypothetical protein